MPIYLITFRYVTYYVLDSRRGHGSFNATWPKDTAKKVFVSNLYWTLGHNIQFHHLKKVYISVSVLGSDI
jgi:hypothetical protein